MSHFDSLLYLSESSDNTPDKSYLHTEEQAHQVLDEAYEANPELFEVKYEDLIYQYRRIYDWLIANYEVDETHALSWVFSWIETV